MSREREESKTICGDAEEVLTKWKRSSEQQTAHDAINHSSWENDLNPREIPDWNEKFPYLLTGDFFNGF